MVSLFHLYYNILKNRDTYLATEVINFILKNFTFLGQTFIDNFHLIFKVISNEDSNCQKMLIDKFFSLLEEKELKDIKTCANNSYLVNIIKNFDKILPSILHNEEFLGSIIIKFDIFIEYFIIINNKDWIDTAKFLKSLIRCEIIFENNEFLNKIYPFVLDLLRITEKDTCNLNKNYKVIKVACKVLTFILKYSYKNIREDIIKFVEKEFVESKSFFRRRYFIPFFIKCVEIFSILYLKDNLLLDLFVKFINGSSCLFRNLTPILKNLVPLITEDIKLKNIIFSKLEEIRNVTNDREIIRVKLLFYFRH